MSFDIKSSTNNLNTVKIQPQNFTEKTNITNPKMSLEASSDSFDKKGTLVKTEESNKLLMPLLFTTAISSIAALGIATYAAFFKKLPPIPNINVETEKILKTLTPQINELKQGQEEIKQSISNLPENVSQNMLNKIYNVIDDIRGLKDYTLISKILNVIEKNIKR